MWCPKCKIEYRKGVTVCADCGTELVERESGYGVDICEIKDEAAADEIVEFLRYSGIEDVEKEKAADDGGFKISVPAKLERKAEKLVHGYLIAKEEEKEERPERASAEDVSETLEEDRPALEEKEDGEEALFSEETEDTTEILHTSTKNEYVKIADKYRDIKYSGITFIFFGILGGIYLMLCRFEVIPIQYNVFVFWVIALLFAGFFVSGIVSIVKSQKLKGMIPEEERKIKDVWAWLGENLTEEMVEGWSDNSVSEGENDLLIAAHIRQMLVHEYPSEPEAFLEMIADEYYEKNYV